jgi:DnaJ-class molecular chaperone
MRRLHFFVCTVCNRRELPRNGDGGARGPWCACGKIKQLSAMQLKNSTTCAKCKGPALKGYRYCPSCYGQHKQEQREREAA